MLTIFNRKEILITTSIEEQARVRNILADNNIKYFIKTFSHNIEQGHQTTLGKLPFTTEYKIYVHKKQYEEAVYYLNQAHRN